jgi:hypothetical protein
MGEITNTDDVVLEEYYKDPIIESFVYVNIGMDNLKNYDPQAYNGIKEKQDKLLPETKEVLIDIRHSSERLGLAYSGKETIQNTIRFAKNIPLDRAQFLLLDVLPGSALWDEVSNEADIDWSRRSYQEVTWVPNTIDKTTLRSSASHAFRSFFFRPPSRLYL